MKTFLITLILLICTNCLLAHQENYKTATAKVNGVLYKAIYKASEGAITIKKSGGMIINHFDAERIWTLKFIDFNGDGYKDLFIEYASNMPGDNNLFFI